MQDFSPYCHTFVPLMPTFLPLFAKECTTFCQLDVPLKKYPITHCMIDLEKREFNFVEKVPKELIQECYSKLKLMY
ncbi:hypothetical protein IRB23SM22_22030 [Alkalibacterium sp. s-m-22]